MASPAIPSPILTPPTFVTSPFISEIHYDNIGSDVGEFIEITGPAGLDLMGWSLVLYNGSNGTFYNTIDLSGESFADDVDGVGAFAIAFPSNGIQNGAPDGMALVNGAGTVIEFLSYEGTLTATAGPANGMTSTDIGVEETGSTPVAQSLKKIAGVWTAPSPETPGTPDDAAYLVVTAPFISELHYDNIGSDTGEFIEITGPAGTDLTGWTLVRYNGNGGATYGTDALSGTIADQFGGLGTVVVDFPSNGLQNGAPDGMALVDPDGNVVEFLSYEGVMTATAGPADGMTSTDIGVAEDSGTPVGQSLQKIDGVWTAPAAETKGLVNGQPSAPPPPEEPSDRYTDLKIHEVQGNGAATAFAGTDVRVQGIVTQVLPGLSGFYMQEEDADADGDTATSEGLFVFLNGATVSVGDLVTVEGTAEERFDSTQIAAASATVQSSGNALPTATVIAFPTASVIDMGGGSYIADLEAYEGMRVTIPEDMFVGEFFNLDRFGEFTVNSDGRLYQYTQQNAPDAAGFDQHLRDVASRSLVIDDGSTDQNPSQLLVPGLGALEAGEQFRIGDSYTDLTGILAYGFNEYRLHLPEGDLTQNNPRPEAPTDEGFRVASFNVLNFFTTIDANGATTGPNALDPRGADNQAEYDRQHSKLVQAIAALDADVLGLVELENDFATGGNSPQDASLVQGSGVAIQELVDGLNAFLGSLVYDWVRPITGEFVGSDAIAAGFIYDMTSTALIGDSAVLDTDAFLDPAGTGSARNRAAIAQTFEDMATGEQFTASVNHFKSKGDNGATGEDLDQGDGQGAYNHTRTLAAQELSAWLATNPTGTGDGDIMILGDLNAYAQEDPIEALAALGYTDLIQEFNGADAYSYLFDGQAGTLDYAMANESLTAKVKSVAEWNINSDEPDAFDYNLDFERDAALFAGDSPHRNSDHDPVVVTFDFQEVTPPEDVFDFVFTSEAGQNDRFTDTDGNDLILANGGARDIYNLRLGGDDVIRIGTQVFDDVRERMTVTAGQQFVLEVPEEVIFEVQQRGSTVYVVFEPENRFADIMQIRGGTITADNLVVETYDALSEIV